MEGDLHQRARHRRKLAQFAKVGRKQATVHPIGIPIGAQVAHDFRVDEVTQVGAAGGGAAIIDVRTGAAGVAAVGVPGKIDTILVGVPFRQLPFGVEGAGDHVVGRARVPLEGDVGEGGFLETGFAAVAHATAEAHGVGDDHLAQVTGLIQEGDGSGTALLEVILAEEAPRLPVYFLRDAHRGIAAGVVNAEAGVHGAVAAVQVPDVDGIPAGGREGGRPGGRGRGGAVGVGVAIGEAAIAGGGAGEPTARFRIGGRAIVVVHDDFGGVGGPLAHQPDVCAGIP